MPATTASEAEEALRLISLGYYTVKERMRFTGISLGAVVTAARFSGGDLRIEADFISYIRQTTSVELRGMTIEVWITQNGVAKRALVLEAKVDDSFITELNVSRARLGLIAQKTPGQEREEELVAAAKPLADKLVGRTVTAVRALDQRESGYELVFADGSSLKLSAGFDDLDAPLLLIDGADPYA